MSKIEKVLISTLRKGFVDESTSLYLSSVEYKSIIEMIGDQEVGHSTCLLFITQRSQWTWIPSCICLTAGLFYADIFSLKISEMTKDDKDDDDAE